MKVKQFYTKVFSFKKILFPFFITALVTQVIIAVLSMVNEQHYIIFADAIASLGLVLAVFLCNYYRKQKAVRVLTTLLFFVQAVFFAAYSFQPFPKAPDAISGMFAFLFYIIYAMSSFALTICALVLHANINKVRNDQTMLAFYIIYTIQIVFSIVLVIGTIINFAMAGYSHMGMVDFINYFAYGLINFCLLTLETTNKQK